MKKAIIFGTGVFPETLYYYLRQLYIYIYGFTVENKYRTNNSYIDLPLVDFEMVEKYYPPDEYGIIYLYGIYGYEFCARANIWYCERKRL